MFDLGQTPNARVELAHFVHHFHNYPFVACKGKYVWEMFTSFCLVLIQTDQFWPFVFSCFCCCCCVFFFFFFFSFFHFFFWTLATYVVEILLLLLLLLLLLSWEGEGVVGSTLTDVERYRYITINQVYQQVATAAEQWYVYHSHTRHLAPFNGARHILGRSTT